MKKRLHTKAARHDRVPTSCLLGLAVFLCAPEIAHATPSARLVYVRDKGAEECPDESALRAAVAARLGYDPFFPYAKATLFAEVTREAGTLHARVKLVDEGNVVRGARELEHSGPRCADLVDAMALTMSIAIDPRSLTGPVAAELAPADEAKPPEPAAAAESAETAANAPPEPPAQPVSPARPAEDPVGKPGRAPRVQLDVHALGTVFVGAAPNPGAGGMAGAELRYGAFAAMVDARFDAKSTIDVAQANVGTWFDGATIAPCFGPGVLRLCAVFAAGQLTASSRGITSPRSDTSVHVLGGARFGVAVPLTAPLFLRAGADLLYAFTPQLVRLNGQDIYELDRFSTVLGVGLGVRLF